jgi:hypothetical protein
VSSIVLAAALLAAGPASARVLLPSSGPLPGSSFQGADGDQENAAPLVDWQTQQAAGRVHHSADPNDEDSAFNDGSKEDEPGGWDFVTDADGVDPRKDNILDAWSAVDQPGADTFLYLGFTREGALGTTFLTFELNHDSRLWDNGQAQVPCRRTGDVLVSYEAQGNDVDVVIQRWVTSQTDPETGCAKTGRLDDFTSFTPNEDAQGAINEASIANRLPGFYATAGTVPLRHFGEAALNLSQLLADAFDDECLSFRSIWMHSRSSTAESSNMHDYVAPRALDVRSCAASGTKFFDSNANGRRDPGEPGIPRFEIWADYDDDGQRDDSEPFSISDLEGQYVIYDIQPPDGTYMLRETLLTRRGRTRAVATGWVCSYPNAGTSGGTGSAPGGRFPCAWGPIDANATPNAQGRDFGNWFPAQLVLEKEIEPANDLGRFDLLLNGGVVLPAAGDGARVTLTLPPGLYDVSEVAAPGTNAADYRSTVECRRNPPRRGERRSGIAFEDLSLAAGDRAVCTFRNVRPGSPAIAIRKTGPATATAGGTLRYTLLVTNPGDVPFPAAGVDVTDPRCDDPPKLVDKEDASGSDDSPGTLDPGDTWTYRCSHRTPAAGDDCELTTVDNTGTVIGNAGGSSVDDSDSIETIVGCPDEPSLTPKPPDPPGPQQPDQFGPVVPAGMRPPNAGDAAVARFRRPARGCISGRVPRLNLSGTRISRLRVYVNGHLRQGLTVRTLQRRVTLRVTLSAGRNRVTVRVTFEPGSGTPAVTLSRAIRICRPPSAPPRFTG